MCAQSQIQNLLFNNSPDYPKVVKVSPSPLCTKRLFEGNYDAGDVVTIPDWAEDSIGKSETKSGLLCNQKENSTKMWHGNHLGRH